MVWIQSVTTTDKDAHHDDAAVHRDLPDRRPTIAMITDLARDLSGRNE